MIRLATPADADAICRIYAPFVNETPVSFETVAPTVSELSERIENTLRQFPWLVEDDGGVRGYCYASRHRDRLAYRWSVDIAAYVAEGSRRTGVGRRLYARLFSLLARQGYVTAYAGITLPNAGSAGLHEAMGFSHLGTYSGAGYKLGAWHDVGWWQLRLRTLPAVPQEPVSFAELLSSEPALVAGILQSPA
jgi:L-amino acid N-acyltransferase YncA